MEKAALHMDVTQSSREMAEEPPKKGVKTKIFGVMLICLASLDAMLFWRGGLELSGFYISIFAAGVAFFIIGTIRGSAASKATNNNGE